MPQAITSGGAPPALPGIDRVAAQPEEVTRSNEQAQAEARAERVSASNEAAAEQQSRRVESGDTRGLQLDVTA